MVVILNVSSNGSGKSSRIRGSYGSQWNRQRTLGDGSVPRKYNPRLDREPDYNHKRRTGSGKPHLETCPTCQLPIPEAADIATGSMVPCSDAHVRCVRCQWPVAITHISPMGTCVVCMSVYDRKRYYRRTGDVGSDHDNDHDNDQRKVAFGTVTPAVDRDRRRRQQQRAMVQEEEMTCNDGSHLQSSEDLDIGGGNGNNQ